MKMDMNISMPKLCLRYIISSKNISSIREALTPESYHKPFCKPPDN